MMIGGAVANAAAFIGGNALYATLNEQGASEETARHNKAMEELQRAQTQWAQRRQTRLDFLNDQLRREQIADKAYSDMDQAMQLYYLATGGDKEKLKAIPDVGDEPSLDEFYQPSAEQKKYELIFLTSGLGLSAWLAFKYL